MRKRTLGVVLVAGLAISGGSAFTGSNTMPTGSDTRTAGYGAVTATGVTVSDVDYDLSADLSTLEQVIFRTSKDVSTGYDIKMTLKNGATLVSTTVCGATYDLDASTATLDDYISTITCNNGDAALSAFDGVGLSVTTASTTV